MVCRTTRTLAIPVVVVLWAALGHVQTSISAAKAKNPKGDVMKVEENGWPRDHYTGPGGGLYTGPGGGSYTGPGGGAYTGPGGGMYTGPGGGMYTGPGGGLYTGPGGGLYTGPGGGLYTGPGGGLYTGPGGGLYTGPGGGRYTGPCDKPYRSNQPPRKALLEYLEDHGMHDILRLLQSSGF
jgi:hypothetical protein